MARYPVRPEVLRLKPYIPGKPIAEVQRELGLSDVIKLASNENSLGPSPKAMEALRAVVTQVHMYPEATAPALREALTARLGLPADWLQVGNGSDELLRLLAAAYVRAGDRVVVPGCSFPNYRAVSELFGATVDEVPLQDEAMDLDAMAALAPGARFVFLCRPNNPTGGAFPSGDFRRFMAAVPPETLVVLDQAYHEFDDDPVDGPSYVAEFPNLVVTRTFSKAYGLAGLRVGYGMARPGLWQPLLAAREPFSVNAAAQAAARAALADDAHLMATVTLTRKGRERIYALCAELGLAYVPSQGNFVLLDLGRPADPVFQGLLRRGIIVRPGTGFGRPTALRVTVGLPHELDLFADGLRRVLTEGE